MISFKFHRIISGWINRLTEPFRSAGRDEEQEDYYSFMKYPNLEVYPERYGRIIHLQFDDKSPVHEKKQGRIITGR
ncbi:MAG: hypothetical protein HC905_08620 [Bacteroidales bacterium]|nr:hypothetical protein [Bacteroidales bacterium]